MFDSEKRWFIRCDTCPDEPARRTPGDEDKDMVVRMARSVMAWEVRDDLHRCPYCVREGRTEMAS